MKKKLIPILIALPLTISGVADADTSNGFEVGNYTTWGDLNDDGYVGSGDLDLVRGNWNSSVYPGTKGDATGDGLVGSADLDTVRANWGRDVGAKSAAVANTPEPASLLIWGAVLGGCLLRRRGVCVGM